MTSQTVQAILLVLCAALMNASYTLPMKLNKKWQWEHSWFAFSILGVAVVPTLIALATIPGLWSTYSEVSTGTLARMVLFGASWGVSLVFFGLAIARLGLAITFAVCLGTSAAVGALTPLIAQHSDLIMTRQGGLIILGVLVIVAGVSLCGVAGRAREKALQQQSAVARQGSGRISTRFCIRNHGLDAEPGPRIRRQYSASRAATWSKSRHDVKRGVVAVPLRRLPAGRDLLLVPHAQEPQCRRSPPAGDVVLLAGGGEYGTSVVWQHHSLQHLYCKTG